MSAIYDAVESVLAALMIVGLLMLWRAVRRARADARLREQLAAAERERRQREVVWPRHDGRGLDIARATRMKE